jgi:hypothetical protein
VPGFDEDVVAHFAVGGVKLAGGGWVGGEKGKGDLHCVFDVFETSCG